MRFVVALVGVVVALLIGSVGLAVAADGPLGSSLPPGAVEDTQARTAFSTLYDLPDGSKATVVSTEQAHFKDADGRWRRIDDELTRASDGTVVNGAGPLDVRLPSDLADPVTVARDGRAVSMRLLGADAGLRLDGETASFAGALPGVMVAYAVHGRELKETLTVHGEEVPSVYRFAVDLSDGLSLQESRDGGVDVVDSSGDEVFVVPPAVMWDAGEGLAGERPVVMSVEHADGRTLLVLRPDADWLAAHAAGSGVVIDPTTELPPLAPYTGGSAPPTPVCEIQPRWAAFSPCDGGLMGWASTTEWRSLVRFDTSSLAGLRVVSATLQGDALSANPSGNFQAQEVSQEWNDCVGWTWAQVWADEFECLYYGTEWTTPGGDVTGQSNATVTTSSGGGFNTLNANVTAMVQDWINRPSSNHGMLLRATDRSTVATFSVGNDEIYTPPRLIVTWKPELGKPDGHPLLEQRLTDRLSLFHDVGLGNVLLEGRDVLVASRGMVFAVTRSYNSLSGNTGMFGRGMTSNLGLDQRIVQVDPRLTWSDPNAAVTFVDESGRNVYFLPGTPDRSGVTAYTAQTLDYSGSLTRLADGSWQLIQRDGTKSTFDTGGYLTSVADKDQNATRVTYGTSPKRPVTLTDTQGRDYAVAYNADGLISSITDPIRRVWSYTYATDGSKRMLTSTDPAGGVTTYGWTSSSGAINRIVTPAGRITKLTYNTDGRVASILRVTNRTNETGDTTTMTYASGCGGSPYPGCVDGLGSTVTDPRGKRWGYSADLNGRIIQVSPPAGPTTRQAFNSAGQATSRTVGTARSTTTYDANDLFHPTSSADPVGVSTRETYDPSHPDQVASTVDELGTQITYSYGDASGTPAAGRLATATVTGLGAVYQYSYNGYGQLQHVTTGAGNAYVDYGYDNDGQLTSITRPNPRGNEQMSYDSLSRLQVDTDATLRSRTIAYDRLDHVTSITYSDGSSIAYEYDADGNQTRRTVTPPRGTADVTTWSYDDKNRVTDQTLPGSLRTHYDYDATDDLTAITDAGGTVSYGYDDAGRLTSVTEPPVGRTAQVTQVGYDSYGNESTIATPNSRTLTYTYNAAGRQSAMTLAPTGGGTALISRSYDYTNPDPNAPQRITTKVFSETNEDGDVTSYAYSDPLARLTAATVRNRSGTQLAAYGYAYDAQGNLTRRTKDGTTTYYAVDGASLLNGTGLVQGSPTTTYSWDRAGFLTTGSDGLALAYNAKSQTTSLKKDTGTSATSVTYADSDQTQPTSEGTDTLTNDQFGIATRTNAGAITAYTRTPDGQLVGERTPSARYFFATDRQGSVLGLTDSTGVLARKLRYDPYGQTTVDTGSAPNAYGYAGGEMTAAGFLRFGKRYYAPTLGRWTQPDPLDQSTDVYQANPYNYGGDDPVNETDPGGTCLIPDPFGVIRGGPRHEWRFTETGHPPHGTICGSLGPRGYDQHGSAKKAFCKAAGYFLLVLDPEALVLKVATKVAGGLVVAKC